MPLEALARIDSIKMEEEDSSGDREIDLDHLFLDVRSR